MVRGTKDRPLTLPFPPTSNDCVHSSLSPRFYDMAFALTTLRPGQASASRFARCLAPAVAPSPSSSTSVRFASSSNSPKRTSTRPAPARKATDKKKKKGSADPVLVRKRGGELVVSDSYLEDLASLQLRPANPSPSNSPSSSRKPKGKASQTPRRVTYSLAQQEEVQAFLEAKKAEERASKRARAELSLSLRKRNRWSSEWFLDEGRELAEIGVRISCVLSPLRSLSTAIEKSHEAWLLDSDEPLLWLSAGSSNPTTGRNRTLPRRSPTGSYRISVPHPLLEQRRQRPRSPTLLSPLSRPPPTHYTSSPPKRGTDSRSLIRSGQPRRSKSLWVRHSPKRIEWTGASGTSSTREGGEVKASTLLQSLRRILPGVQERYPCRQRYSDNTSSSTKSLRLDKTSSRVDRQRGESWTACQSRLGSLWRWRD